MSTEIELRCLTPRQTTPGNYAIFGKTTHIGHMLSKFGWSIAFDDSLATPLGDVIQKDPSDNVIEKLFQLKYLVLNPGLLSERGLTSIGPVIKHVQSRGRLDFEFDMDTQEHAEQLLNDFGRSVKGLTMRGEDPDAWIVQAARLCQPRASLENLEDFRLINISRKELNNLECIDWIEGMVKSRSLRRVSLESLELGRRGWKTIVSNLDVSALEELSFEH
ncbi:hypothetical protein BGX26_001463, partial [Mortierella sp. AD094]